MALNDALRRYLRNPDVARWLFCNEPVTTVSPTHLDSCFVYSIAFNPTKISSPRTMHIEDMLLASSTSSCFILGVVWGLGQPHIFSRTPLMLDKLPVARRFAVDLSQKDALEFMEFLWFEDGKAVVVFRRFLHTRDAALPCIVYATLHNPSTVQYTLGHVLMRATVREAAQCPVCSRATRNCDCAFDAYAPTDVVSRRTFTWNHFNAQFMNKARLGSLKIKISAYIPNVGEMCIMNDTLDVLNIMHVGNSQYLNLLRRKAVHGLGINVVVPRTDSFVLALADENDFVNLHNNYVSRKRSREADEPETNDPSVFLLETTAQSMIKPALESPTIAQQLAPASYTGGSTLHPESTVDDILSSLLPNTHTFSTTMTPKPDVDVVSGASLITTRHSTPIQATLNHRQPRVTTSLSPSIQAMTPQLPITANRRTPAEIAPQQQQPQLQSSSLLPTTAFGGTQQTILTPAPPVAQTTTLEIPELEINTAFEGVTASSAADPDCPSNTAIEFSGGLLPASFDPTTITTPPSGLASGQAIPDSFLDELETLLAPAGPSTNTTGVSDFQTAKDSNPQRSRRTGVTEPKSTSSVSSEDSNTAPTIDGSPQISSLPTQTHLRAIVEENTAEDHVERRQGRKPTAKRAKRSKRDSPVREDAGDEADEEEERKHACTQCSSRFKMRGDLLRHVKIVHEGRRMFSCEHCGKSFGHSGHLNRHISSVHLQQRRFKCHLCGFQFFQASHLQSHIGHIHNAKKSIQCKHCGLRVSSQAALRSHVATSGCGAHDHAPLTECQSDTTPVANIELPTRRQLNA